MSSTTSIYNRVPKRQTIATSMTIASPKPDSFQQTSSFTTKMDAPDSTVTFYDIASGPPVRPFAPNPWKAR